MSNAFLRDGSRITKGDGSVWIVRYGRRALSECTAYKMASRHFDNIVPEAHLTEFNHIGPHVIVSAEQRYIEGRTAHSVPDLIQHCHTSDAIRALACMTCLDYVLEIGDRHENNWLLGDDGKIYAIDNEVDTAPGTTLYESMRPAARVLLLDDAAHTNEYLDYISSRLAAFRTMNRHRVLAGVEELKGLYRDLVKVSPERNAPCPIMTTA